MMRKAGANMGNRHGRLLKMTAALLGVFFMLLSEAGTVLAAPAQNQNGTYIYNSQGKDASSPDAYAFVKAVKLVDQKGVTAANPQDLFVASNGDCYIADTDNNRILITDHAFTVKKVLTSFTGPTGEELTLNKPEGIFVSDNGEVLIADTQNNRILRSNVEGKVSQVIQKPAGMTGVQESDAFYPTKLVSDDAGRIYVVARNINMGIVTLTKDGNFMGYIGAPKVQYNLAEMIWRRFSTKEQREKMVKFVPTEYSNIMLDQEGFLYGTISYLKPEDVKGVIESKDTSGSVTSIKKLNSVGDDVLKRNGTYPPVGDLLFEENPSRIEDVALGQSGVYSMLDSTKGRIFTYDDNGNLLFAFGGNGQRRSDTQRPSAIAYQGTRIIVLDSLRGELFIYDLTSYGRLLMRAVEYQFKGDFDNAYRQWSEITKNNINFEYAFIGLGNTHLMEKNYESAMECFEYAGDKENYSKAKELHRKQQMETWFPILFIGLIVLVVLWILVGWLRRFLRYCKGDSPQLKS